MNLLPCQVKRPVSQTPEFVLQSSLVSLLFEPRANTHAMLLAKVTKMHLRKLIRRNN
jgi:hypothetical protein